MQYQFMNAKLPNRDDEELYDDKADYTVALSAYEI
jgi:hypothetical protein